MLRFFVLGADGCGFKCCLAVGREATRARDELGFGGFLEETKKGLKSGGKVS